jgi:hypothetical protein
MGLSSRIVFVFSLRGSNMSRDQSFFKAKNEESKLLHKA